MAALTGFVIVTIGASSAQPLYADPAAYKPNWQIIKADNGAPYQIDLNSIRPWSAGKAEAVIYIDEGGNFSPSNVKRMLFDCHGHMTDISGGNGMPTVYLPPLSVGGRLATIACAAAKATGLKDAAKAEERGRSPAEYCKDFSANACDRMKKVIESRNRPVFCKPGFGLVGSSLTPEQLRICYVMQ